MVGEIKQFDQNTNRQSFDVELEIYTDACTYAPDDCGFNYFKMAQSDSIKNSIEKSTHVFDLSLHPNPTNNNCTLTLVGYKDRKIDIFVLDQSGKFILTKNIDIVEKDKYEIDIESQSWSKGVYIVRVGSEENTWAIKLVKE